jgi:tetratricopeptide (TPR) repeat protein
MEISVWAEELIERLNSKKTAFFILIAVSFSVFVFQNDKNGFEKGHHGFLSSHGAVLARNLSGDHFFLLYTSKEIDSKGKIEFQTYSRFPVTTFFLLKMAMGVVGNDLSMKVAIARQIMNLFLLGALLFAFLSVYDLSKNYLIALSVIFLSFSSAYIHYYNDMIFNDIPALFGFILAGNGLIRYELYGKRFQMFVKALIGISFGWQIFGMLFAYIIAYIIRNIYRYQKIGFSFNIDVFILGFASLLLGAFLLFFNLSIESHITGKPIKQLSTVASAKQRFGQVDEFNKNYGEYLSIGNFTKDQMHRIGAMTIPYLLKKGGAFYLYGIFIFLFLLLMTFFIKQKVLLFSFLLSGFFWAFPMRSFTFSHDFQSIFYIGVPLSLYYILLNTINKKSKITLPFIAILSMLLFIYTNITFNLSKSAASEPVNSILNDFQNIIDVTDKGNTFFIDGDRHSIAGGYYTVDFCLADNFFTSKNNAEYFISRNKEFDKSILTPENKEIYLFRGTPRFAMAFYRRGLDHLKKANYDLAVHDFKKAIEKKSDFIEAYYNMGIAKKKLREYHSAIMNFETALKLEPENIKNLNSLSWLLATCNDAKFRDGKRAVKLSEKAVDLDYNPITLDTLAAAYAEVGEFDKALSLQEEVIISLRGKADRIVLENCRQRFLSYKNRHPWRE